MLYLAPMAGFTDSAMRALCRMYGADVTVSEMISAKGMYYGDKKTDKLSYYTPSERPYGIQIFGSDPSIMAYAAEKMSLKNPDFININSGCPTPKIVSCGDGSALMKDEVLFGRVVEAVVKASSVPVSVKIRTGWDREHKNSPRFAEIARECGAYEVHLHCRTKEDGFSGDIDYETAAETVQKAGIPVIVGGDITDGISAERMLCNTGAKDLMIGRAAIGNPFIFEKIKAHLSGETYTERSLKEKMEAASKQIELMYNEKGKSGILEARKHAVRYLKGLKRSHDLKIRAVMATTPQELLDIFKEAYENE